MNKHIRECVRICMDGGLTDIQIKKGGKHLKINSAQGMIVMPCTPSDRRWRYNAERNIRSALRN